MTPSDAAFWDALMEGFMRDGDREHNNKFVKHFASETGIPEDTVWANLRERLHVRLRREMVGYVSGNATIN
jgi:hypothetical protein